MPEINVCKVPLMMKKTRKTRTKRLNEGKGTSNGKNKENKNKWKGTQVRQKDRVSWIELKRYVDSLIKKFTALTLCFSTFLFSHHPP
jgi:hypothetical protein